MRQRRSIAAMIEPCSAAGVVPSPLAIRGSELSKLPTTGICAR
jgi:hypothetical protein